MRGVDPATPEGKWALPSAYNAFYPKLPKINNEPPGPGSSAGGMNTTGDQVAKDFTNTISAGWALYVGHSEWCVWNGHLPQEYWNSWRELRYVHELPQMPECAAAMKTISGGQEPEMPLPMYDEPWIMNTVRPAIADKYAAHGQPLDDGYAAWVARTQYDYHAGMSQQESLDKHLAELEAALSGG